MKICTIFVSGADNCRILADGTKYTGTSSIDCERTDVFLNALELMD